MNGKGFAVVVCVSACLLGSGCMSARTITDLKPGKDAALKSDAGMFRVAALKFESENQQMAPAYEKYQNQLLPLLQKECAARYPSLFSSDSASAIPLGVQLESKITVHQFKIMAWMYGTLLICSTILPCPAQQDEDFDMKVCAWNGQWASQQAEAGKTFRNESHMWLSLLTPTGLITIPGESDFPKISSTIFDTQGLANLYLKQLSQQLATALAKTVATQDPAYWTTQPRWTPSAAGPSAAQPAPAALPTPTETAAPF